MTLPHNLTAAEIMTVAELARRYPEWPAERIKSYLQKGYILQRVLELAGNIPWRVIRRASEFSSSG